MRTARLLTRWGGGGAGWWPSPGGGGGSDQVPVDQWGGGGGRGVMTWSRGGGGGRCSDLVTWSRGEGGGGWPLVLPTSPPFSDRMTNTCENITFARFAMRAVKTYVHGGFVFSESEQHAWTDHLLHVRQKALSSTATSHQLLQLKFLIHEPQCNH